MPEDQDSSRRRRSRRHRSTADGNSGVESAALQAGPEATGAPASADAASAGSSRRRHRRRHRHSSRERWAKRFLVMGALSLGLLLIAGVAGTVWVVEQRIGLWYAMHLAHDHMPGPLAFLKGPLRSVLAFDDPARTGLQVDADAWLKRHRERAMLERRTETASDRPGMGRVRVVGDEDALMAALELVEPGDVIEMAPGKYLIEGHRIEIRRPGAPRRPITLRAAQPGTVTIRLRSDEGFAVIAPYWHFEDLDIQGDCEDECEHAFHVTGDAHSVVFRRNLLVDFDAHLKINGTDGKFPDGGIIEGNVLRNRSVRTSNRPVAFVDAVGASWWKVRDNLVADFAAPAGQYSYGVYFKGGGQGNLIERNLVLCQLELPHREEHRVGLSFGGGGTGKGYCRDSQCLVEHQGGVMRNNVVANCYRDAGIYLNRAADSLVAHNLLYRTLGMDLRHVETSAVIANNLMDGPVRLWSGASANLQNNLRKPSFRPDQYESGFESVLVNADQGDLRWRDSFVMRVMPMTEVITDFCARRRDEGEVTVGPFEPNDPRACGKLGEVR